MTVEIILIIISGIFSGTGIAALVGAVSKKRQWERERAAQKEDADQRDFAEWQKNVDAKLIAQGQGIKFLLYDRIQHLGKEYISEQSISFENRKNLHAAHNVYHNGLQGNGDLDALIKSVDDLPLKIRDKGDKE